jgi:DNA-binding HxlR family transcriptional regulator
MTTTPRHKGERTYGQYCPIAAGLDLIGDRWTLLILRELSMGDLRFTDLRGALSGIAPNLLTERLRSLQAAGLVTIVELPPPVARSVYRLTDEGRRVWPVLRSVARFGVRFLEGEPGEAFDARRAAHALLAPWRRRPDGEIRARLVVTKVDDGDDETDAVDLVLSPDEMRTEPPEGHPDVTLRVAIADLVLARRTGGPLVGRLSGAPTARRAFLDQFDLRLAKSSR